MKLSHMVEIGKMEVIREGEFTSLGFITHGYPVQLAYAESEEYMHNLEMAPNITCLITTPELRPLASENRGLAVSGNPRRSFYSIHNHLARNTEFYGKHFENQIAETARIHPKAFIAERDVCIGEKCVIEPNVTVLENSVLKNEVVIRAGSVIGGEGFAYNRIDGEIMPVRHAGGVLLHDRVEIQCNTVIDRAVFGGYTEILEDTRIDNLVHVAHNVRIGRRCLVVALAMLGGSVTIGDDVWIGPSAAIRPEVRIDSGAWISMGSVVTNDVGPGQKVSGHFAIDHDKFIQFMRKIR